MQHFLIDGTNLFYRAYYTNKLVDKKNRNVSGIFGSIKMFDTLLKQFKPRSVVLSWDIGIAKKKSKIYPDYKKGRRSNLTESEKENISWQMNKCREIFSALPVKQVFVAGIEADDVLGFLAEKLKGDKIIVSNDSDFFQCIDDNVAVFNPSKGKMLTDRNIDKYLGFPVVDYVLWKSLRGDSSDNLKGVNGIGPKKATQIVNHPKQFKIASEWKPILAVNASLIKLGFLLDENEKNTIKKLYLSQRGKKIDKEKLRTIFTELNFRSLLKTLEYLVKPYKRLK